MPTSRPRYVLTESDALRAALDAAGQAWPADRGRPTALLLHLVDEGVRALGAERAAALQRRLEAVEHLGDGLEGVYPPGALEALREDWPA